MTRFQPSIISTRKKRTGLHGRYSRSVTVREPFSGIYRMKKLPKERKISLNKKIGKECVLLAVLMYVVAKINQNLRGAPAGRLLPMPLCGKGRIGAMINQNLNYNPRYNRIRTHILIRKLHLKEHISCVKRE